VEKNQVRLWAFRAVVVGAAIAGLALMSTLLFAAAKAGVALIGLVVIGLVGFGLFSSLPLLGQVLENRLLMLRKSEARKNPIEQLEQFFIDKRDRLNQFRSAVIKIDAQIRRLKDMVAERKKTKPGYDPTEQEKAIKAMEGAHFVLKVRYEKGEIALNELKDAIDEQRFKHEFAQAGQSAIAALNSASAEDLIKDMLADEANKAVLDNFNTVFAELELDAKQLTVTDRMDFGGMYLDLKDINLVAGDTQ